MLVVVAVILKSMVLVEEGGAVGYDGGNPSGPTLRGGDGGAGRGFPCFPWTNNAPAVPNPGPFGTAVGPTGLYGGGGGANYYDTPEIQPGVGGGGRGAGPDIGSTDSSVAGVDHTGGGGGGANYYSRKCGCASAAKVLSLSDINQVN